jgi:hypothetical protein
MAINNCKHAFEDLANQHFPNFFIALEGKLKAKISSQTFTCAGNGYKRTIKTLGLEKDFQGCYVFFEDETPMYVGISQNVVKRLCNHFNAANHYESSLVFKVACERGIIQSHRKDHKGQIYREEFEKALQRVQSWSVTFIEVPCHVSLYLFEVYVAMRYDTAKHNSFQTH